MTENILMSGISPSVLDSVESDPLSNRNYEAFKQAAIDLGFAHESTLMALPSSPRTNNETQ